MQDIEIKCKPFYIKCRIGHKIDGTITIDFLYGKQTKTRPNQESGYVIYKFTKYHELFVTSIERDAFIKKHLNDQCSVGFNTLYNELTNTEDYGKNIVAYKLNPQYKFYDYVWHITQLPSNIKKLTIADQLFFVKFEDGERVEGLKKTEIDKNEKRAKQEADFKIMTSILKTDLNFICEKHGMRFTENGIYFIDHKHYNQFIKEALKNTIIKELSENGYEAKINPRIQSIKYNTQIVTKQDLKFKN